jgi:hypothetical protein
MSNVVLPASCYEEALPDLRAPYLPTQIRPLIIQAPKNSQLPCRIALYTIGETLMDRFNLCCAGNWEVVFIVETHKEIPKQNDGEPVTIHHYFKIACSLTVFGNEHHDIGEGEAESETLAEFNARAQAFKRAARWHGPGQCLYVFGGEDFVMWRGPEAGKLHIPKSGTEPHRKPFFDNASKQAVRDEYAKWLKDEGEGQFGVALNHMEIAEAIRNRALHRPLMAVPDLSRALPEPSGQAPAQVATQERLRERRLAPASAQPAEIEPAAGSEQQAAPATAARPAAPARQDVARLPMPDTPRGGRNRPVSRLYRHGRARPFQPRAHRRAGRQPHRAPAQNGRQLAHHPQRASPHQRRNRGSGPVRRPERHQPRATASYILPMARGKGDRPERGASRTGARQQRRRRQGAGQRARREQPGCG